MLWSNYPHAVSGSTCFSRSRLHRKVQGVVEQSKQNTKYWQAAQVGGLREHLQTCEKSTRTREKQYLRKIHVLLTICQLQGTVLIRQTAFYVHRLPYPGYPHSDVLHKTAPGRFPAPPRTLASPPSPSLHPPAHPPEAWDLTSSAPRALQSSSTPRRWAPKPPPQARAGPARGLVRVPSRGP